MNPGVWGGGYLGGDWWSAGSWLIWRGGWSPAKIQVTDPLGNILSQDVNEIGRSAFYVEDEEVEPGSKLVQALIGLGEENFHEGAYSLEMTALDDLDYWVTYSASQQGAIVAENSILDGTLEAGETQQLDVIMDSDMEIHFGPIADAGINQEVEVFIQAVFNGSDSYDPDGIIESYEWDFGDGVTDAGETVTHAYEHIGIYTVTLSVTDNDGEIDTDTLNVEVIQKYGLWANSTDIEKAIEWSGNYTTINGHIHSNDGILINGSDNTINRIVYYVTQFENEGDNVNYNSSEQISPRFYPVSYDIIDYQPGGIEAVNAQNEGKYHYIDSDLEILDSNEELDGLYFVTGDVEICGDEISGTFTIVAEGNIEISGSNHNYGSYCNELLFFSQSELFELSGSKNTQEGITFIPEGEIELSGSKNTITGSLFGNTIELSGSELMITPI